MMFLLLQLVAICGFAWLMVKVIMSDLADRRYSITWGVLLLFSGNKKPLVRTLRNRQYMGALILVAGLLAIIYSLISEIYEARVADKTWTMWVAITCISIGGALRFSKDFFTVKH